MDTKVKEEEHDGFTVEIHIDEVAENPREWYDHVGHMVCFHRRYDLGDEHDFGVPDTIEELDAAIKEEYGEGSVVLPLFLLDHSGITMSTTDFRHVDPQGWDSGFVGFIVASEEDIEKEWGGDKAKARDYLLGEVDEYDSYLTGSVYGYVVLDDAGEVLDSCWGFYGDDAIEDEVERVTGCYRQKFQKAKRNIAFALAL